MQSTGHIFKITPSVKREIVKIVDERIGEALVTKEDFSELKLIVKELAEAQKRTEEEVCKLIIGLNRTREDLGGLSRSFSYAFENEAYRMLHKILKARYAIEVKGKVIRAEVGGFGETLVDAKNSLKEALEAFFEECESMGTLEEVLEEAGLSKTDDTWETRKPIEESFALAL